MGSRSYIGYLNEDGNVTASYCHQGSQMEYNGKSLLTHYNTDDKAKAIAYHGETQILRDFAEQVDDEEWKYVPIRIGNTVQLILETLGIPPLQNRK